MGYLSELHAEFVDQYGPDDESERFDGWRPEAEAADTAPEIQAAASAPDAARGARWNRRHQSTPAARAGSRFTFADWQRAVELAMRRHGRRAERKPAPPPTPTPILPFGAFRVGVFALDGGAPRRARPH